ncbi:MAG: sulfatase family protein [Candidatus Cyclobacteriaceae bacterium M3_2C_046]
MKDYLVIIWIFLLPLKLAGHDAALPNIVIFLSDDHGAEDAGCYGNQDIKTPVIDQLAREGMQFNNAYTPSSICAPARATLFTGLYPFANGCNQNHSSVKPGINTLPDYLKPLGYQVVLAGKSHIKPVEAFDFKYLERYQVPEFLKKAGKQPFCLIIAYNAPHQPYFNHKEGHKNIMGKKWLPRTEETLRYTAAYYDHVGQLDHEIGEHLYWLEKYGFSDAVQIYTSDHGPAFPFAKWTLYNQGIKVPLIIKWPGVVKPGAKNNDLVSFTDILPTLLEIAGAKLTPGVNGKSILKLLKGQQQQIHDFLFATYTNEGVMGADRYPIRAVFNKEYKLIVNLENKNAFKIKRMDQPDTRALIDSYQVLQSWLKSSDVKDSIRAVHHWHRPVIELYHLAEDPFEMHNLINDPAHNEIVRAYLDRLMIWMTAQKDPVLTDLKKLLYQMN